MGVVASRLKFPPSPPGMRAQHDSPVYLSGQWADHLATLRAAGCEAELLHDYYGKKVTCKQGRRRPGSVSQTWDSHLWPGVHQLQCKAFCFGGSMFSAYAAEYSSAVKV